MVTVRVGKQAGTHDLLKGRFNHLTIALWVQSHSPWTTATRNLRPLS